jgi:predicted nuclease with TOPRIM domain
MARRRSILKRSSISDMTKTVSWADKEDLVAKIAKVSSITEETPEGSNKLESVRAAYDAQMDSLDAFQKSIEASLTQLRGEVAKLEDMESTLLEQKTILTETFLAFEKKRLELHEQGRCFFFLSNWYSDLTELQCDQLWRTQHRCLSP